MNFLYSIYFSLPNFARIGVFGKIINKILAMLLKRIFDYTMPAYFKRTAEKAGNGLNKDYRDEMYVVSLTSFPARINDIWITIETILRQNFKPDMIILWLGKDKFSNVALPQSLTNLEKRGLTIKFIEDLRSHTKYYYAFDIDSSANIITLDDDEYYPENTLQSLVDMHRKNPDAICANRAHKLTFKDNKINPYRKWKTNYKGFKNPHSHLLQTGVCGVLYPPGSLHSDVFDKELFKKICLRADDVWLYIMAYRNGTKVTTNKKFNKDFITVSKTQKETLVQQNVFDGGNDQQLKNICDHFEINLMVKPNN